MKSKEHLGNAREHYLLGFATALIRSCKLDVKEFTVFNASNVVTLMYIVMRLRTMSDNEPDNYDLAVTSCILEDEIKKVITGDN